MTTETDTHAEGCANWQAIHIFYAANSRPMITECIRPLVVDLRVRGLLDRYFFINYWLEGPHLRLRLRPSSPAAIEEVLASAEKAIAMFLRTRPALYEVTSDHLLNYYDTLFDIEYPNETRAPYVGPDGRMRLRDNNTYSYERYQPEYDRYGGPAGIELAEWHFEQSSDLVVEVDRTMNVHLRTVRLGVSLQLMVAIATSFLPDEETITEFFNGYTQFWHRSFAGSSFVTETGYDRHYATTADRVVRRFREIRKLIVDGATERLPDFLRGWAEHCRELSERVRALAAAGDLVFGSAEGTVIDQDRALRILLNPYIHMTNNRLTTTISDESYLAHLLGRSMRERLDAEVS